MNSLNLFILTRLKNIDAFNKLEKQLSKRKAILKIKKYEMNCVIDLVNSLCDHGAEYESFNNFYHSYEIPQIGKEFDLLKIGKHQILNIE